MTRLIIALVVAASAALGSAEDPYVAVWSDQPGTTDGDLYSGVAVDVSGNVFITGCTQGDLGGPNAGSADVFLIKYDSSGSVRWSRQIGTERLEEFAAVAVDADGNAYISGGTQGSLAGPIGGIEDAFLFKFDAAGNVVWSRQIGTSTSDLSTGVAVDGSGNSYIAGGTAGSLGGPNIGSFDVFVVKHDPEGNQLWSAQIGSTRSEISFDIAVDAAGNAYLTGITTGSWGGRNAGLADVFIAKVSVSGTLQWARQIGTPMWDEAANIAVDASANVYVTGWTEGSLAGPLRGPSDAFLVKFDASGNLLWSRQFGTPQSEWGDGVAVDSSGSAYVTGWTDGVMGEVNVGFEDAFLRKFDASGMPLWTAQFGTPQFDEGVGLAMDTSGSAYIGGITTGSLGGPFVGSVDAFVVKFGPPCDPCDMNCDGLVDALDIEPFIGLLFEGEKPCGRCTGDVNGDGLIDARDIEGFINCLFP